jgi:hypothetical protein
MLRLVKPELALLGQVNQALSSLGHVSSVLVQDMLG